MRQRESRGPGSEDGNADTGQEFGTGLPTSLAAKGLRGVQMRGVQA